MCWPHETAPGSEASCLLHAHDELLQLGLGRVERREEAGRRYGDDLTVPRQKRVELVRAEELHRQMPVALALRQNAGAQDCVVRLGTVAADEVEQLRCEMQHRADERHHGDEHVPARPNDADELGDANVGAVEHVAERSAEADGRVEARIVEAREVGYVGEHALRDAVLEPRFRHLRLVQLELLR